MEIQTDTPLVKQARYMNLQLLLVKEIITVCIVNQAAIVSFKILDTNLGLIILISLLMKENSPLTIHMNLSLLTTTGVSFAEGA